jgi:hypothetical protein
VFRNARLSSLKQLIRCTNIPGKTRLTYVPLSMVRPDFFLVGAPKSGTTAMAQYLAEHPEVSMCAWKEVHYFAPDLFPQRSLTESEYLDLFPSSPGAKRVGEASVWYLYSEHAAERISAFAPQAEIIIMLRDPVEMLHSLHAEFSFTTKEQVDFETALALDPDREAGRAERRFVPRSYRSAAMYSEQVERYMRLFGRDRLHIVIFDDLSRDASAEYRRVCRFLGVDGGFTPDLRVVNSSKRMRSPELGRFLRHPPETLRRVVRTVIPPRMRTRLWKKAVTANRVSAPRVPMPDGLRRQLQEEFADDVDRLSELIQRDLSHWSPSTRMPSETVRSGSR